MGNEAISSEEITIPITSLVVDNDPADSTRPKPTPTWNAPFLELLGLLKIIDTSQPSPKLDGQRFCFQPSRDLSEISRIFVSVTTSSSLQYDIDLKTIRLSGSDDLPPAVTKLQEYADQVLQRTQRLRDSLLERAADLTDITDFLQVDMLTCPLCHNALVSCVECDAMVACTRITCHASLVIACQQCFEHNRMACHPCLAKNETVPPLICCPVCQGWCCREDSFWCAGLVVQPTVGSDEFAELSEECDWDSETIVRSHPPKPGPCPYCNSEEFAWETCRNTVEDMEPDRCPSQTPFMTDHHLRAATCPECVEQSPGRHCACELSWLCDTCVEVGNKSLTYPFLLTCPRCGVSYCTSGGFCGNYIDICRGCKGVIVCNDCQEEAELPGDVPTTPERPKQIEFAVQCNHCETWSCADCYASDRSAVCYLCDEWFCYGCLNDKDTYVIERCPFCCGFVCTDCKVHHLSCPGAMMLKSVIPRQYLNHFQV